MNSAFARASSGRFRLLHFSVQHAHVHLLVEAEAQDDLRRGVQGLVIRVAKAINRAPRSSARWFSGWRTAIAAPPGRPPVVPALTWLACVGWRRHGLLGIDEAPHRPPRR
jgi:hypothetical protein